MSNTYYDNEDYNNDEDIIEIMQEQGLDYEDAEEVRDLMDSEGVNLDEAIEIKESGGNEGGCSWIFWMVAIVVIVLIF